MRTIRRVLIANRGEIAVRIARTCHAMGIGTVAVFSDADAGARHVAAADVAVRIGGPAPADSYLRVDALIAAARATGCDAVHPGYGFVSENATAATAFEAAGLVWIGPPPAAIDSMGSKQRARRLAAECGVPTVPGYEGDAQDDATLIAEADRIGLPVLIKASAGGGGKGMQVVRDREQLRDALDAARRIAEKAFGDGTLLLEKYVDDGRHVEIQILGDTHGNVVHLLERECSIQRRHQKVVEESPSPALTPELRATMGEAAVRLARHIGYSSAGTVEFLLGPDGSFYFLEVNTRLQVEHPVTEAITGRDLVREQIRVARGEALGFGQDEVHGQGHAIEVRLYAEDAAAGFLPSTGTLRHFAVGCVDGVRVDAGVGTGDAVSMHYDPMLAKVIARGATRDEAIARLSRALDHTYIAGVTTNRDFLRAVLAHPAFVAGDTTTHFIDRHLAGWHPTAPGAAHVQRCAAAVVLADEVHRAATRELLPALRPGFRNVGEGWRSARIDVDGTELELRWRALDNHTWELAFGDSSPDTWHVVAVDHDTIALLAPDGRRDTARLVPGDASTDVFVDGLHARVARLPRFVEPGAGDTEGGCVAPMPGAVLRVACEVGARVAKGDVLVVLEAMKMEHSVTAPADGEVVEVRVRVGQQVDAGAPLVVIA
jgi:acetyl-CoA carboxylase biotin carboxylase subunit